MPDSAEDNGACRICMDPKDNCVSLFSHDLSKKVMEIADVQVEEDDGLPNSICTECEQDLEKCYEFRLKVQVADKKFRENIKFSKVDIEECNIKEERYVDDGNSDNMDDKDSVSMDDEHCNDVEPDVPPKVTEETEAADPDPLNHVVVVEEKERKVEMSDNPICQDDAMTEEPLEQKIEDVALDPLECMKEEAETEIMDIDSSQPDPFGPSSSVRWAGTPESFSFVIPTLSQGEQIQTKDTQKERNKQPFLSETISGQVQEQRIQRLRSGSSQSGSSLAAPNLTKGIQSVNTLLAGHFSSLRNKPTVTISKIEVGFSGTSQQQKLQKAVNKQRLKIGRKTTKSLNSIKSQVGTPSLSNPEHLAKEENEFFCSVCNVDCGNIALLQEHKSRKDFICRACTASFVNHSELELHFISHKKYTCEACKKVFYIRKDLHHHKSTVSFCNEKRNRIPCGYCHRTFLHRRNLNQHMKLDHNANPEDNFCHICKTGFKNHSIFVTHLKSVHIAYEGMECGICHQILLGPRRLKYHINTHHIESTESCPICEKVLTSKSIKSHMETHDEEEAVCTLCKTVTKNKNALKRHLKIHKEKPGNKTHTCSLCNETFNSLQDKLRHKKRKHTKTPQPVFCDICGKQYKSMQVLKTHLVIHSDDKPFVCDVCGAAFKTKAVLRTHNRIHTEVRKYSCPHCSQGFRWKQTFDKHVAKCESSQADNSSTEPESE